MEMPGGGRPFVCRETGQLARRERLGRDVFRLPRRRGAPLPVAGTLLPRPGDPGECRRDLRRMPPILARGALAVARGLALVGAFAAGDGGAAVTALREIIALGQQLRLQ